MQWQDNGAACSHLRADEKGTLLDAKYEANGSASAASLPPRVETEQDVAAASTGVFGLPPGVAITGVDDEGSDCELDARTFTGFGGGGIDASPEDCLPNGVGKGNKGLDRATVAGGAASGAFGTGGAAILARFSGRPSAAEDDIGDANCPTGED